MTNTEASAVLVKFAKEIQTRAKRGDVPQDKETLVTKRAHNDAWRLLSCLVDCAEHIKESDMYWTLLGLAFDRKQSDKEQWRLRTIAKREDYEFMKSKAALEEMLAEIQVVERDDPKGLVQAKVEANRKAAFEAQEASFQALKAQAMSEKRQLAKGAKAMAKAQAVSAAAVALKKAKLAAVTKLTVKAR